MAETDTQDQPLVLRERKIKTEAETDRQRQTETKVYLMVVFFRTTGKYNSYSTTLLDFKLREADVLPFHTPARTKLCSQKEFLLLGLRLKKNRKKKKKSFESVSP